MIVVKYMALLIGAAGCVIVCPLLEGCCLPATSNPIAAAMAGAKIFGAVEDFQSAQTPEEVEAAVLNLAETIAHLRNTELASAVNIIADLGWSLDDAQAVKDLAAQVDEELIENVKQLNPDINLDDPEFDPQELTDLLAEVGVTVTQHQIDLLTEAYENLKDLNPDDILNNIF